MVAPASTQEVAGVVTVCARHGAGIVPQGGNTGLCGGAVPDLSGEQVLLSLSRMNRIRRVDPGNDSLVAEAGCILADVQAAAAEVDRCFPLSLAAEGSCQIGGNLSTNAGGLNVIRYGMARQQVLGLEVVLADGTVWEGLRELRKDTAGYDLKQVFIGSEGTLGIITAAALKLAPKPANPVTFLAAIRDAGDAVALLGRLRSVLPDRIDAFELISDRCFDLVARHLPDARRPFAERPGWAVLADAVEGTDEGRVEAVLASCFGDGLVVDAILAKNKAEAAGLWRLRHAIPEAERPAGYCLKHDIGVPVGRLARFLAEAKALVARLEPDARPIVFGHVGDGNLHYNVLQPAGDDGFRERGADLSRSLYDLVAKFEGTFSAEHGIGVTKKELLRTYRSEVELGLMRTLKTALDPDNRLNPGKVI
jgi:FAD/FMN-containing dehydrogenase